MQRVIDVPIEENTALYYVNYIIILVKKIGYQQIYNGILKLFIL
jgi:hypothetical protein